MKAPTVEVIESRLFDGAVADEIISILNDAIAEHGSASLVLSGGSTPGGTYRALARPPRVGEVEWSKVRIYLGDERWVPVSDNQSNEKLVRETLLNQLDGEPQAVVFPDTARASAEEGAREYERAIRKAERIEHGLPRFDVVLLGIGADGHVASVFPQSSMLQESGERLCASTDHPSGGPRRVTLTPRALTAAANVIFLVKGESKAAIVRRAVEGSEPVTELPARLFSGSAQHVTWFVDTAAGQGLTR